MILQKQLYNHDCLTACICSLLDWHIKEAPTFENVNGKEFWDLMGDWLASKGWMMCFYDDSIPNYVDIEDSIYIVSGPSPNIKGQNHSVLWRKGKLYFDPSNTNKGLAGDPTLIIILAPLFKENIRNTRITNILHKVVNK